MWKRYSPNELDRQFSPSLFGKLPPEETIENYYRLLPGSHKLFSETLKCELDIQYMSGGPALDIFYPDTINDSTAVLVYIHGGCWEEGSKEYGAILAGQLTTNNVITVAMGYDLAPKVSMATIVHQCQSGCVYIARKFPKRRLYISGHSAGGHLAAMMGLTRWSDHSLPDDIISGIIPMSGIYDLAPIQKSRINKSVQLTDDEVQLYSPVRLVSSLKLLPKSLIVIGELESEEFNRQFNEFYELLKSNGVDVSKVVIPDEDHFTLVERLTESDYMLTKMIMDFIRQ